MEVYLGQGRFARISSLAEASAACRKFLDETGLGASAWAGGAIRRGGTIIAHVSFNGRVWAGRRRRGAAAGEKKLLYEPPAGGEN